MSFKSRQHFFLHLRSGTRWLFWVCHEKHSVNIVDYLLKWLTAWLIQTPEWNEEFRCFLLSHDSRASEFQVGGRRDDSAVQSTGCSSRGPEFNPQHHIATHNRLSWAVMPSCVTQAYVQTGQSYTEPQVVLSCLLVTSASAGVTM